MKMYTTEIETPGGLRTITCTDQDIDDLADASLARILRDQLRAGVFVAPAEVARQYAREQDAE